MLYFMERIDQGQCSLLATFQTKVKQNTLEFCPYCAVLSSTGLHFRTALGKISSSIVLLIVFRLANANYTVPSLIFFNSMPKSNILFCEQPKKSPAFEKRMKHNVPVNCKRIGNFIVKNVKEEFWRWK